MKVNLKGMTRKELEKLKTDIDKQLDRVAEVEKREALAAAQKAAKAYGFSLAELSGVKASGKPGPKGSAKKASGAKDGRSKVAPKYAHPDDPTITWTGRGRKPKWVEAHLENGGDLATLLI